MPKSAVAMETHRELLFSIFSLICQYALQTVCVCVFVCIPHCVVGGSWTGEPSQPEHHLSSQSSSSPPHQRPATTRTRIWMTQCWQLSRSVCTVHQCQVHALNIVEMHANKSVAIMEFITNELPFTATSIHIAANHHLSWSGQLVKGMLFCSRPPQISSICEKHCTIICKYINSIYFLTNWSGEITLKVSHDIWNSWQAIYRHGQRISGSEHVCVYSTTVTMEPAWEIPPPAKCTRLWAKASSA